MAEQPEQVLPEERVTPGHRVVEGRVPQPVEGELEQGHRDDRHGEEQEERGHQGHPHEDRHAHEGHARRPEVENGGDEVGGGGDRGDTQHLEAEGVEREAVPRRVLQCGERGVAEPAAVGGAAEDEAGVQEQAAREEHPVAEGVQAREGHVPGADHDRHEVVEEGGRQRHDDQEDHRQAVHREQHVVLVGRQHVGVGASELRPDEESLEAADQEEEEGRVAVQHADALVVGRRQPAPDAGLGRRAAHDATLCHCRRHQFTFLPWCILAYPSPFVRPLRGPSGSSGPWRGPSGPSVSAASAGRRPGP